MILLRALFRLPDVLRGNAIRRLRQATISSYKSLSSTRGFRNFYSGMPVVKPGSKVLVSGANGYLACWVIKTLLERGYTVRGTVRSENMVPYLKKQFEKYVKEGKLELIVVADITKNGAFDRAVNGMDAIQHIASPVSDADYADPDVFIRPAVNGTTGLLRSAATFGSSIRRVVVTSSTAAVVTLPPPNSNSVHYFSEKDWNEQAVKVVEEKGKDAPGFMKYRASKTLAERGAWKFMDENKGKLSFDLTTFTPPVILGPPIDEVASAECLNFSVKGYYEVVVNGRDPKILPIQSGSWIDVRDLAYEHVLSMEMKEAGGERFISSTGNWTFQDFYDVANSLTPSPIPSHPDLPKGTPGSGQRFVHRINYVTEKEERVFKYKKRTIEEMSRDLLAYFEEKGW